MAQLTNRFRGECHTCKAFVDSGKGVAHRPEKFAPWLTYCKEHAPEPLEPDGPTVRKLTAEGVLIIPYEPDNQPLVRAMPGARWNPTDRHWTVSLKMADRPRVLELADRMGLDVDPALREIPEDAYAKTADLADERFRHLYPFQREGVRFLSIRDRALLGDDMGLGKTIQILAALEPNGATLAVVPNSLKFNWRDECRRWRPDLTPVVMDRKSFRAPCPGELCIVNYEGLADNLKAGRVRKVDGKWVQPEPKVDPITRQKLAAATLVVDEAHAVKNRDAGRSMKIKGLSLLCKRVWFLTGTPLMNRPPDLYGVLDAGGMAYETFGGWQGFIRLMDGWKDRFGGYSWGCPDPSVPERLRRVMLRRTREEALPDLPRKTRSDIPVNGMPESLRRQLDELWDDYGDVCEVTDELPPFEEFSKIRAKLAEFKTDAALEIVAEYEEQDTPLVVFSAHKAPCNRLAEREGWAKITGDTKPEDRAKAVRDFQEGRLKGVALTIAAGGVGLTLTRASHMLFVDLDWTYPMNAQAEDRICRIGQTSDKVLIKRLVADHALERHITALITQKIAWIDMAVERKVAGLIPPQPKADGTPAETAEEYLARMRRLDQFLADERARRAEEEKNRARAKVAKIRGQVADRLGERMTWADSAELTPERQDAIRAAIKYLASVCDYAQSQDGQGFSKSDTMKGHILAATAMEQEPELRVALALLIIYRRQCEANWPILYADGAVKAKARKKKAAKQSA